MKKDKYDLKDIRRALISKGISQTQIANMLHVKPGSVHNVITGRKKNPRIRFAIAMAAGVSVEEIIWPEPENKKPSSLSSGVSG